MANAKVCGRMLTSHRVCITLLALHDSWIDPGASYDNAPPEADQSSKGVVKAPAGAVSA